MSISSHEQDGKLLRVEMLITVTVEDFEEYLFNGLFQCL